MRGDKEFHFFGSRSKNNDQLHRLSKFFPGPGHAIRLYGDSQTTWPSGGWALPLSQIWAKCSSAPRLIRSEFSMYCEEAKEEYSNAKSSPNNQLLEKEVYLSKLAFDGGFDPFSRLYQDLIGLKDTNSTYLQKVSIIIQHPIAHIAREHQMLDDTYNVTRRYNARMINAVLDMASASSRAKLAEIGWELDKVILFDGLPQHFPTVTGGFDLAFQGCRNDSCDGKWPEEKGKYHCKGPIPRGSNFKRINDDSRYAAIQAGFDMRFYGRTWEFTNLFWWQHLNFENRRKGSLDCTHSQNGSSINYMYKYFLQAMIDDFFE